MSPILLDAGRLLLGGVFLYAGAEWLVSGAASLARGLGVRPLVIGVTVVAFGTSAPELTVSIAAALEGKGDIVLGNVVGSNIANLGLILGLTALVSPPSVAGGLIRREIPVLVATALVLPALFADGLLSRVEAFALAAGAVVFSIWMLRASGIASSAPAPQSGRREARRLRAAALALIGLVLLVGGGKLLVDGAVGIARAGGMSDRTVGLTIVAVGTSLPELAASLVAALRGHSELAVGNVVGSNIFNVLLILGVAGLVRPVSAQFPFSGLDSVVLIGMTLIAAVALRFERRMRRVEGAMLLVGYAAFLAALAFGIGGPACH